MIHKVGVSSTAHISPTESETMSSIQGIGTSNTMLQNLQSSGRPSDPPPGPPPGHTEAIESVAQESGLDSSEISDLMAALEEAASSAKESGKGPEAMKQALDSVLEEAGVDTDALHEKLSSLPGGRPSKGGQQTSSGTSQTIDSTNTQLDTNGLLGMLRNLPVGSLIDSAA